MTLGRKQRLFTKLDATFVLTAWVLILVFFCLVCGFLMARIVLGSIWLHFV